MGPVHRFNLARIGLDLKRDNGEHMFTATLDGISISSSICGTAAIRSRFTFDGKPVEVHTVVHPDQDVLAIRLKSPMVREARCDLKIEFPVPARLQRPADRLLRAVDAAELVSAGERRLAAR